MAEIYKHNFGYVTRTTDPDIDCDKVLLIMYARYPAKVELKHGLTKEQHDYLVDNYIHLLDEHYIESILDSYKETPILYKNGKVIIEYTDKQIFNLLHYFNTMKDVNNYIEEVDVYNKFYVEDKHDEEEDPKRNYAIIPFDVNNIIKGSDEDIKLVNQYHKNVKHDAKQFQYSVNPYGYKNGMTIVKNDNELVRALKNSYENIFIDGNLSISLSNIFRYNKIIRDGKKQTIDDMKPQYFKSWAVGPNCKELPKFFIKYPYQPQIEHWILSLLVNADGMFMDSNVVDMSGLYIAECKSANNMFNGCKNLIKLPRFGRVEICDKMCYKCINLLSIDDALLNPGYISSSNQMFGQCHSITEAFINCESGPSHASRMFVDCKNLRSAFMNCKTMYARYGNYDKTFVLCPMLEKAFINCDVAVTRKHRFQETFTECESLSAAFIDCTLHSDLKANYYGTFRLCPMLRDVFINTTFVGTSKFKGTFENIDPLGIEDFHVFEECVFKPGGYLIDQLLFMRVFDSVSSLFDVFDTCKFERGFSYVNFICTFVNCKNIEHVLIDCTIKSNKFDFKNAFINCNNYFDVFEGLKSPEDSLEYDRSQLKNVIV